MLKYWVWLSELKGLRNQTKLALLRRFGDPESIFYADPDELMLTEGADPGQLKLLENHDLAPADKILADCQRLDIQLLTFSDAAYPGRLKNIYDPPALLYYKGKLPLLDDLLSVAVVGTRDCTPYGVACAEKLGFGLASGGAVVVSGLAKGDFVQKWKSSRPSVASVSSKGKITAKKKSGSAKVSAYLASGKILTVTVIVQKKAVKTTALRDVPKRLTLRRGRTVKLQPTRLPVTSKEKITYKSANTRIAKVSKKGVITGKKAGTVKITVRSGRKKAVVTVKVK